MLGDSDLITSVRNRNDHFRYFLSLRANSPIWASEASLAKTREGAAKPRVASERPPRPRVLARLISLTQIGELARRLVLFRCPRPLNRGVRLKGLCHGS